MITFPVSAKHARPSTQQVDYFNFDFDDLDLHACWRRSKDIVKRPGPKSSQFHIQAKRRENATWRRFFQNRNGCARYYMQSPDWEKQKEIRGTFFAPFYSSEEVLGASSSETDTSSLYTLRDLSTPSESSLSPTECPIASNSINNESANIKPALKRKFHSKLHIGTKVKHRRSCSESVIYEDRKSAHFLPCSSLDAPSPKEIVLQYFGGYHSPESANVRHISFNSKDEEWVFDTASVSQEIYLSASIDERFRALQALINEEFEMKRQMAIQSELVTESEEDVNESIDDDTNTATPYDSPAVADKEENVNPEETGFIVSLRKISSPISSSATTGKNRQVSRSGERNCSFVQHMARDRDYCTDTEFLDYPDEEIAEYVLEPPRRDTSQNSFIAPAKAQSGLISLGVALLSSIWW